MAMTSEREREMRQHHEMMEQMFRLGMEKHGSHPPFEVRCFAQFAFQYVLQRAPHFTPGDELRDCWQAVRDAEKMHDMILAAQQRINEQQTRAQQAALNAVQVNTSVGVAMPPPEPPTQDDLRRLRHKLTTGEWKI